MNKVKLEQFFTQQENAHNALIPLFNPIFPQKLGNFPENV